MGDRDCWEENKSGLALFFREHPETAGALEESDNADLNGADLAAKSELFREAWRKCYPPEYISAFEAELDFISGELKGCPGPITDIASGRLSLFACDAKELPFGPLPAVTTCLGLQNIPEPEMAVRELTGLLERGGFRVTRHGGPTFRLPPTPVGVVAPGAGFDALPVRETWARFVTMVCE